MDIKYRLLAFIADRFKESSTWQGVAFILAYFGSRYAADFDVIGATAAGATISATIKVFFPDIIKNVSTEQEKSE